MAMAVMAEAEDRLLQLSDFEALIACLKSEAANWSDAKLRGLLTAAYLSSVSEDEIALAAAAVSGGADDAAGGGGGGGSLGGANGAPEVEELSVLQRELELLSVAGFAGVDGGEVGGGDGGGGGCSDGGGVNGSSGLLSSSDLSKEARVASLAAPKGVVPLGHRSRVSAQR
jgi:hypothetical protein